MLSHRQRQILRIIVGEFVRGASPVSSEALVRKHGLSISAATVRIEMGELEGQGYISRPHPSAGAVPSDLGYREYVEGLQGVYELPVGQRFEVRHRLEQTERDLEAWARETASLLAFLVRNMVICSVPRAVESRLHHIELVWLQEFVALLILVMRQARVRKELLSLEEPATQEVMQTVARKINAQFGGSDRRSLATARPVGRGLEGVVVDAVVRLMEAEEEASSRECYVDGLRHLLMQPEFAVGSRGRELVEAIEDKRLIGSLVTEGGGAGGAVRVIIGRENKEDVLRPFSVVICDYGVPGEMVGALGVVGPTRMDYDRTVAGVSYVSSVLSEMVGMVQGG